MRSATGGRKSQEGFVRLRPAPAKKRRENQERGTPLRMTTLQSKKRCPPTIRGGRYKGDCKSKDKAWNLIPSSYSDRCRTYGALSISYRVSQPSRAGLISAAPPALRTIVHLPSWRPPRCESARLKSEAVRPRRRRGPHPSRHESSGCIRRTQNEDGAPAKCADREIGVPRKGNGKSKGRL